MANFEISLAVDDVINALQAFVGNFMPAVTPALSNIVRGEVNRTPMPPSPCVVLTELLSIELEVSNTNYSTDDSETAVITGPTQINIQCDFYGESGGDYGKAFIQAFRSLWGYDQFPQNIRPLYTDGGRQVPLVTGEEQYERRWTVTASLQYNPSVTVPQQAANALKTGTIRAVETYDEG